MISNFIFHLLLNHAMSHVPPSGVSVEALPPPLCKSPKSLPRSSLSSRVVPWPKQHVKTPRVYAATCWYKYGLKCVKITSMYIYMYICINIHIGNIGPTNVH